MRTFGHFDQLSRDDKMLIARYILYMLDHAEDGEPDQVSMMRLRDQFEMREQLWQNELHRRNQKRGR